MYYTAPKPIDNVKNKSGKSSWKKRKNVSGYVGWYSVDGAWKLRHNYPGIYRESLYFGIRTTKTYLKRKDIFMVTPYKKHSGYYYMDHHQITNKKSKLTSI